MSKKDDNDTVKWFKIYAMGNKKSLKKEELEQAAINFANDEDASYSIVLKNTHVIKPNDITEFYERNFKPFDNSVNWNDVYDKMVDILIS